MRSFLIILVAIIAIPSFGKKDPELTLKYIDLFNKTVKIKVPEEFKQMNSGEIKKTYVGLPTIKMAYANDDQSVRIAFGADELLADDRALPKMTSMMKEWLQGRLAKNKWKDEGVKTVNGNKLGYLEYILKKPEKNYEYMFFTLYRGQMLSCSIHAPKKGWKFWREFAGQMEESLKLLKEKE